MFHRVDDIRIDENRARARLGMIVTAPAVAAGLGVEAFLPGAGVLLCTLFGLLAFLLTGLGHTALARAREAIGHQAWAARVCSALALASRWRARREADLRRLAARRRARLSVPRLAAGVTIATRILPVPRARPA
jgi:hypothetical protein